MNSEVPIAATSSMSNLTLHGLLGGFMFIYCVNPFFILYSSPFSHFFLFGSTSHDQKIVVLDFSAGLDAKLFV